MAGAELIGGVSYITRHGDVSSAELEKAAKMWGVNLYLNKDAAKLAIDNTYKIIDDSKRNPTAIKVVAVPPVVNLSPTKLGPETIIPDLGYFGAMSSSINPSTSLGGFVGGSGILTILWKGLKVAMLVADLAEHKTFQKLGQRLDPNLRMRFDTNRGEGRGRYVTVRGADGAVGGEKGGYDQPSQWWEWWKSF
jgi:hypothetical protein